MNERTALAFQKYIVAASDHGLAIEEGDPERANSRFDELVEALRVLTNEGQRHLLVPLLALASPSVRVAAATHLLPIAEDTAVKTLEEMAGLLGRVGFSAEMVLEEWKKGTLVVP